MVKGIEEIHSGFCWRFYSFRTSVIPYFWWSIRGNKWLRPNIYLQNNKQFLASNLLTRFSLLISQMTVDVLGNPLILPLVFEDEDDEEIGELSSKEK